MKHVFPAPSSATPNGLAFDSIVALGSNMGDKTANIDRAIALLTQSGEVRLVARSGDYATPPWGKTDQDWFVNAAMSVKTELTPHDLLARCKQIEREMGRVEIERWGPRVIDLDVLVYRDTILSTPELTLPHPHIGARAFVLGPLMDIAPDLVIGGRTVRELYDAVDKTGMERLD
ncbi:2-amino-4-hydroxy-6- hydroxymethyldihydropteridine pyrophosphokinase [Hyphomicrobium sulfonivorans]|uniref:2-amino-4-hydroxy-6-hydroxymethyldihydropteridine pyrophosphokinase n=1 Tax=Hyphomicrobium sulfonivorans TaxID=121290 RepID=A0A109BIW7_HYPSL|nr:2-amino-4-hydroxy-6-hydroxymethyldihydropteridine diphosphokinase [Hyphomicrobium sulfonivorans]KWT69496.1 2-amino-4-hydroxy-6- hydroxymethyldihydropteridine pyrophosphokinase [Hyphomicrobium sulfonivorans]